MSKKIQRVPETVWLVMAFEDLSGLSAFDSYEKAETYARGVANRNRDPIHIFVCQWKHAAVPADSTIVDVQP